MEMVGFDFIKLVGAKIAHRSTFQLLKLQMCSPELKVTRIKMPLTCYICLALFSVVIAYFPGAEF